MRVTALTIALLLSGTAIAQTTTTTEPTTGTNTGTTTSTDVSTQTDDTADVSTDTTTTTDTGTTDTGTMSTATTDTGTMSTGTTGTMSSSTGTMSSGTMSSTGMQTAMAPASGQVVEPGNQNPEEDARGISVMSAAAIVPPGWNGNPGAGTGGPLIDPTTGQSAAETNYPACSRTVTDNCVQTYERGRSR